MRKDEDKLRILNGKTGLIRTKQFQIHISVPVFAKKDFLTGENLSMDQNGSDEENSN